VAIFFLFFYLCLHSLYEDKDWDLSKYIGSITNIVCSSLLHILDPFFDLSGYIKADKIKRNKKEGKGKYIFFGILISLPLLFIVLLLLSGADAVFSNLLDHIFDLDISIDFAENIWGITFLFIFAFFASYSIMSRLMVHNIKEEVPYKRNAEPVMGITFTGILSLVYLVFCYIQVVYLFGQLGALPKGYTYSSYAREGFFQLVFVCLINLALILICIKRFRENKILKGILTFISICTYIMIASSFYRMMLYISAYYMTFLRFFVLWALIVISLLMGGAVYMIYREKFPFTRYFLTTVTALFLLLSFSRPDYWIARYNLDHSLSQGLKENDQDSYDRYMEGFYDYHYLVGLSNDAAPAIFGKAKELGYEDSDWFRYYVEGIVRENNEHWFLGEDKLPQKLPLRKWNYSRWRAIDLCIENKQGHA